MESFKENFKTFVRVRPFLERELKSGSDFTITDISDSKKDLHVYDFVVNNLKSHAEIKKMLKNPKHYQVHTFTFDYLFDAESTQEEVYDTTSKRSIEFFLKGYNASILAYGQTGTGKTFTIEGEKENPGIIYQVVGDVLNNLEGEKDTTLTASYLQIYNEQLNDLLTNKKKNLDIKKAKHFGVFVENLTEKTISTLESAYDIIAKGSNNRTTASTKANDQSSRSHAVFILKLERKASEKEKIVSKLFLVDLAGSERIAITGVKGARLEEAKKINTSLSELSNVILSLSKPGKNHVTYRNSKLTRLLENSLGGNSFTSLIATVSPSHISLNETISTLKFASRAKKIKNKVTKNKIKSKDGHLKILKKYNNDLKKYRNGDESFNDSVLDPLDDVLAGARENNEYDDELLNYNYNNKVEEERLELYKEMLMNQREVLINLTNKLNNKNMEIMKLKQKVKQGGEKTSNGTGGGETLKKVKEKVDRIVDSLSQKNKSIDLQSIAEDLLFLQALCNKNLKK